MERDFIKVNEQLRFYQKMWLQEIVDPWVKSGGCKKEDTIKWFTRKIKPNDGQYGFSEPFFSGIYEDDEKKPFVLFVGQETNEWGNYDSFKRNAEGIKESQDYSIIATKNNVVDRDIHLKINGSKTYNSHSFWQFIRDVYDKANGEENQIRIAWTELDKIHYRSQGSPCVKLWKEDEEYLSREFCREKNILLLEIETIKPDLIVFLTGDYEFSMRTALKMDGLMKPTEQSPVRAFSVLGTSAFWSYHPQHLSRNPHLKRIVLERIVAEIRSIIK